MKFSEYMLIEQETDEAIAAISAEKKSVFTSLLTRFKNSIKSIPKNYDEMIHSECVKFDHYAEMNAIFKHSFSKIVQKIRSGDKKQTDYVGIKTINFVCEYIVVAHIESSQHMMNSKNTASLSGYLPTSIMCGVDLIILHFVDAGDAKDIANFILKIIKKIPQLISKIKNE